MSHKIIKKNCCGFKTNYNELLQSSAELKPTTNMPKKKSQ